MEDNYPKAYKEVIEVLNYVPQESVEKIPQSMIETFKAKMDNDYDFKVDINKSFEEQDLLEETKAIFANIFRDFWATPYQKERIEAEGKESKKYHTHTLRHTGATLLYNEANANIFVLKIILGHESLDATQVYTHVSDKKLKELMQNFNILDRKE